MDKPVIEKSIQINASAKKVWTVFTNPSITRQMGGEYLCEWKSGSSISWKGQDGTIYTNGTIIQLKPEKLIKHTVLNPGKKEQLLSVITYELIKNEDRTILNCKEELNYQMTKEQFKEASEGWDLALKTLKETAEK
jgi:uncharacterized protein YndB with AHSA1/START domain